MKRDHASPLIAGDAVAPFDIEQKLQRRLRLIGPQGMTGMALAGIDMAVWDALAQASGLPLVRLLGGTPQPVAAYNSCGLGLIGPERAAPEARALAAPGFTAIKVRLGYAALATDLAVMRAVREAVGPDVLLMIVQFAMIDRNNAVPRSISQGLSSTAASTGVSNGTPQRSLFRQRSGSGADVRPSTAHCSRCTARESMAGRIRDLPLSPESTTSIA